jgi:DNA polymerase III subunit gamma/tau
VTTGQPDATAVRSMWTTVREKVRERRRPTDVMLDGAVVLAVEGDTLVLSHVSGPLAKRINEARNVEIIRDALKDALGVNWNVRCEAGAPAAPAQAERSAPAVGASQAPDADEESMLAQAQHEEPTPRRDPEEVALELLQNELGARRIES